MRWMDSVIEATNMNVTQLREAVEDRRAWRALVHGSRRVGHDLMTKQQQQYQVREITDSKRCNINIGNVLSK